MSASRTPLPDQRRQIAMQVVRITLWVVLATTTVSVLLFLLAQAPPDADLQARRTRIAISTLIPLAAMSGLALLARGRFVAAIAMFALILYAGPLATALVIGLGVHTIGIALWAIVIMLFGFVWGSRAAIGVTALFIASIIGLMLAETGGVLPGPTISTLGGPVFFGFIFFLLQVLVCWLTVRYSSIFFAALEVAASTQQQLERSNQALRQSEDYLTRAQAVSHTGSWKRDAATGAMECSAETYRILGLNGGAPISAESYLSCIHPDDRHMVIATWDAALQGHPYDIEHRLTSGAQTRWVHSQMDLIRDAGGTPTQGIGTLQDITERKQMEDQVRQLAFYDSLTQLPNRRLLDDRLRQTMAASKRSGCHGALMFLDLDNFKPLNDTHGHAVGDQLLSEAAERLKNCVRETDTVARFGGDEFVVVLSDLDTDQAASSAQAASVAEKIRDALSAPYILTIKPEATAGGGAERRIEHHCTASIGVSLFIDQETSQGDILKWADAAMYQAKDAGRNLIRFYAAAA